MFHLNFEVPDDFSVDALGKALAEHQLAAIVIEEIPHTKPRLLSAKTEDPKAFYYLGACVSLQIYAAQIRKLVSQ